MATRRSAFTPTPDHSAFIEEFQQASEVKLDAQARLTLIDAITREFIETFGAATAWSKKAVAATKRFARDGTINALLRLMSCHTSAFTMVVYETALRELGDSTELHVSAHQVSARAAQIRGLIANIPRQTRTAALPPVVRALVDGANHWLSSFEDAPRRPRRPMNTHVDLLVLRVRANN